MALRAVEIVLRQLGELGVQEHISAAWERNEAAGIRGEELDAERKSFPAQENRNRLGSLVFLGTPFMYKPENGGQLPTLGACWGLSFPACLPSSAGVHLLLSCLWWSSVSS